MTSSAQNQLIVIEEGSARLEGMLQLPEDPIIGMVLFAHGSGSSRLSPRNKHVAAMFRNAHIATLLADLLSSEEEQNYQMRFDISLLSRRLDMAAEWLLQDERTRALPLGLFGASTGAAAALQVAAEREADIAAVVARGGRVDLAGRTALTTLNVPTLLIVGGLDNVVIDLNRAALASMECEKRLEIVPDATHLFEEEGKLEIVASMATDWFTRHMEKLLGSPYQRSGDYPGKEDRTER